MALGVYVACLVVAAQAPATSAPAGAPGVTAPAAAQDPAGRGGAPVPGGRGTGGRGPDPFDGADLTPKDPILPVSAEEQQKRFVLQPGYRIEPVLTEPDIQEPTQIAFDGNGRMFVVEIRAYMQDADATGELDPIGRISLHEDVDNDGIYEKHSVFVDRLVFPRFVLPFGANSMLTMESNQDEVWRYTDTNGDGVADRKELFATDFGRAGNVEHQQSSCIWGMDNWLYCTYNAFRVRWTPDGVLQSPPAPTARSGASPRTTTARCGSRVARAGCRRYFQFPIHYGNFRIPDQPAPASRSHGAWRASGTSSRARVRFAAAS